MLALTPEFIALLQDAVAAAIQKSGFAAGTRQPDPFHVWLDSNEARAFLRQSKSAFERFKAKYRGDLRVSTSISSLEPRYQLASLQKIMADRAVGGLEPNAGTANQPVPAPAPQPKPAASPKRTGRPQRAPNITPFPRRGADVRTPAPHPAEATLF